MYVGWCGVCCKADIDYLFFTANTKPTEIKFLYAQLPSVHQDATSLAPSDSATRDTATTQAVVLRYVSQ